MRKFILAVFILAMAVRVSLAEGARFYVPLSITELPAGSTVQITISGTGVFSIGGSTMTTYTSLFVIPRTTRLGTFNVGVSSANVYSILHGENILK